MTKFGGTSFAGVFFRCLFFLGQGENWTGKKLAETQSMKIHVKSGEISQERWKNEVKRRESQTYTYVSKVDMLSNTQNSITGKHEKRFEDIKNRYGRQVGSRTSKKNRPSGMWGNLILDSLDVRLHLSNISEVRNLWTSRMKDLRGGPI